VQNSSIYLHVFVKKHPLNIIWVSRMLNTKSPKCHKINDTRLWVQLTALLSCHHCLLYLLCCRTWRINWLIDWLKTKNTDAVPILPGLDSSINITSYNCYLVTSFKPRTHTKQGSRCYSLNSLTVHGMTTLQFSSNSPSFPGISHTRINIY